MTRRFGFACVVIAACGGGDDAADPDAAVGPDAAAACDDARPWASAAPLLLGPTQETAAVAVGATIYVLGGFHGELGVIDAVQAFDTATCTWSSGPPLPLTVHHANAAVVDGTIYVLGGLRTLTFTAIDNVWAWNPATEAGWTARRSMPAGTARGSAVVGVIDGTIYLAGGYRGGAVAEVSTYDPIADAWRTALPPLPAARDHGCGGVVGGKLYVTGGRRGTIDTPEAEVYEYTPGGGWIERAPMPTARGGTACGVIDDRIVVVGGEGNPDLPSRVFPQVEAYAPATDTWSTLAPMPTPRHGMGAAAVGGRLYVPGGAIRDSFGAVATHEILTP